MNKFKSSSKKKIAFLGGGAYTIPSYRDLLNALSRNYDITVYFEFYEVKKYPVNFSIRMIPEMFSRYRRIRELSFALLIFRDFIFNSFDLVHAHSTFPSGFWGIIIGKIFNVKIVLSLDAAEASAVPEINFGDLLSPRRTSVNKWVINHADEVIALTQFMLNEVRTNLRIERFIHVVPRGISKQKFQFIKKPIGSPLTFINVAYLNPVKDQETLLKSFELINKKIDCTLLHLGEDFGDGTIQKLVKELRLDDKVKFLGLIPHDKLLQYYSQADILLHTSRYESQAVVVNEAMTCGLLVCGTHVGLMADLSNACCLTVKPGDFQGLAQTVLSLITDVEKMEVLREKAYLWASQHDLDWTALKHETIYENLLNEFSIRQNDSTKPHRN